MPKTVLITGASSGIGQAIALAFARTGVRLMLNARRNADGLASTVTQARLAGADCEGLLGDVSDYAFCQSLYDACAARFGLPDVLVNNAGISHIGLFQDMQPAEWKRLLDVNLGSVMNLSRLCVPAMVRRKSGTIINISSVWGNVGASCEAVYSASKGAVNAFTRALAKELAPSGVRVNAIACGAVDTPMNAWLSAEEETTLKEEIPAGRLGTPAEIADLALFLSTAPDYLTGQVIAVDGGWI